MVWYQSQEPDSTTQLVQISTVHAFGVWVCALAALGRFTSSQSVWPRSRSSIVHHKTPCVLLFYNLPQALIYLQTYNSTVAQMPHQQNPIWLLSLSPLSWAHLYCCMFWKTCSLYFWMSLCTTTVAYCGFGYPPPPPFPQHFWLYQVPAPS